MLASRMVVSRLWAFQNVAQKRGGVRVARIHAGVAPQLLPMLEFRPAAWACCKGGAVANSIYFILSYLIFIASGQALPFQN